MSDPTPSSERLFTLQSPAGYGFEPGRSSHGEQVLIGLIADGVVAVFFSPEGRILRSEHRPVDLSLAAGLPGGQQWESEGALLWEACRAWQEEVGFIPATIRVLHFALPKWRIGTANLPDYLFRFLRNPNEAGPHEKWREQCYETIAEFQREGNYILWWQEEYWIDRNGHIFAT